MHGPRNRLSLLISPFSPCRPGFRGPSIHVFRLSNHTTGAVRRIAACRKSRTVNSHAYPLLYPLSPARTVVEREQEGGREIACPLQKRRRGRRKRNCLSLAVCYVASLWAMAAFCLMSIPAAVSFRWIEKPFLRLRKPYLREVGGPASEEGGRVLGNAEERGKALGTRGG